MEQTKTRGGARSNAGRKKSSNPKSPIAIYLENSLIEKLGGKEQAKKKLKEYAETTAVVIVMLLACLADNFLS